MINGILSINLQQAFSQVETWFVAFFVWLGASGVAAAIIGCIVKKVMRKINNQTSVSKSQIEEAATETAKMMVGKSFNVNIKSEVDKSIQSEIAPIKEKAENAAAAAKNAEIAAAHILLAQSRSRLLNKTEQAELQAIAKNILAHANGSVIAPAVIEIAAVKKEEPALAIEEVKKTEENASLISFNDVN